MNACVSSSDFVFQAYRLLKQDTYYAKMDLFLRADVAAYEASDSFQQWQERDYATSIGVVCKVPQKILQEDSKILMWYDKALTRTGEE